MHAKDLLRQEFIGLPIEIVGSKNKSLLGIKGTVMDETKNTLVIESKGKMKKILKNQITFTCTMNGAKMRIDGSLLVGRSEERLKK